MMFFLASFGALMGQSDSLKPAKKASKWDPNQIVVVRDRLNFDIFHSFWMGTPKEGEFMKFNPGFNVSAMWDFKMPQNKSLSFGLGVGFSLYTQYSNCILKYDYESQLNKYYIMPSDTIYKKCRMTYSNVHIPFEIRYRHPCGFKFSVGVHVGLVTGLAHKYKGDDWVNGGDRNLHYKNRDFYDKQRFSADVYMRMGWKAFAVFYSYQLNRVFDDGKGPKMNPMSVGLSISLF